MAALVVFMIRLNDMLPQHGPRFKGIVFGQEAIRKTACTTAFSAERGFADPDAPGFALEAGKSYVLNARCRKAGYLHVRIVTEGKAFAFFDLPVGPWSDAQALRSKAGETASLSMPQALTIPVKLSYGFTAEALGSVRTAPLETTTADWSRTDTGLMWAREAIVPIRELTARR